MFLMEILKKHLTYILLITRVIITFIIKSLQIIKITFIFNNKGIRDTQKVYEFTRSN